MTSNERMLNIILPPSLSIVFINLSIDQPTALVAIDIATRMAISKNLQLVSELNEVD